MWPATAALVVLALAGRLRAAVIVSACALFYGFTWDGFVATGHGGNWALAHVGGETLWVAAALAGATAYRTTMRWHITRAIAKLGVRDRVQLVIIAFEDGLVGPLS